MWNATRLSSTALLLFLTGFTPAGGAASAQEQSAFDCGYRSSEDWLQDFEEAVRRGEIPDPAARRLPNVAPRQEGTGTAFPCLTRAQIFPFEDSAQVLLTNFTDAEMFQLMTDAANQLLATHGDNYDFIAYFLNFTAHHTIGAAFYAGLENDVSGIGLSSFNHRACIGLAGSNVEGYVMMWDVNSSSWAPGAGSNADFTRLALGQEFEHRFAMFLPDLADGRQLQGDGGSCGRGAHWNWRVDGQGSSMEISNWIGSNPATLVQSFVTFNTDIPGSVWSYTDLYLMGYVTPAEMDAGNSELRYMNTSTCSPQYSGVISSFNSSHIVASAGPRIPAAAAAQKDFRAGWIMIHLPGALPTNAELDKAVGILEQQQIDWNTSTLGRGHLDNTIFGDCNCNGISDVVETAGGAGDVNGNGVPDECELDASTYCTAKTTSQSCLPFMSFSGLPNASSGAFMVIGNDHLEGQAGLLLYSYEKGNLDFHGGKLCVKVPFVRVSSLIKTIDGVPCTSCAGTCRMFRRNFNQLIQSGTDPLLTVGARVNAQILQRDPSNPLGFGDTLSNGLSFKIAP